MLRKKFLDIGFELSLLNKYHQGLERYLGLGLQLDVEESSTWNQGSRFFLAMFTAFSCQSKRLLKGIFVGFYNRKQRQQLLWVALRRDVTSYTAMYASLWP